jgi:4-amino-4-deoxy-L-arabinose transferase-like glycosyltransferase
MVAPKSRDLQKVGLLLLFSVVYLFIFVRVLWRVGDEGLVVYGAQLVAEGNLPYRDFFEVFGPGSFYWLALFFKVFGTSFFVARMVLLITGAVIVILIYWMTRRIYHGSFDMLPSLFFLIVGIPLWPATNHHWDSILFALLAIALFFLWQDKGNNFYLFASGMLSGVTSCFIQQKGLLLILALIVTVVVNEMRKRELRKKIIIHCGLLLIGYSLVGISVIFYFYLAGGLQELIFANLIWPLKNYHSLNICPYGYGLFELHFKWWSSLMSSIFPPTISQIFKIIIIVPYLFVFFLPGLILIVTLGAWWRGSDWHELFGPVMFPYWLGGLALWISELHRKDIMHLIYGSPLLIIIFFVNQKNLFKNNKAIYNISSALLVFCLIFLGIFNAAVAVNAKDMNARRGTVYLLKNDEALKFLNEKTRPGEEVFVYPYYAMYYFLANVKNPTRYNNLLYQYHTQEQFLDAIKDLEQKKVTYILWDTLVENQNIKKWFPQYQYVPKDDLLLEAYFEQHYEIIGIKNGFRVLKRKGILAKKNVSEPGNLPDDGG